MPAPDSDRIGTDEIERMTEMVASIARGRWVVYRESKDSFITIGCPVIRSYDDDLLVAGECSDWGGMAEPQAALTAIVSLVNAAPALLRAAREVETLRALLAAVPEEGGESPEEFVARFREWAAARLRQGGA